MKKSNLKKLTVTAILAAVAVVGSLFSFPVFGSKCAPVQHMVNILCAVTVGPWWALAQINALGCGNLPVCVAKTQYSLSDDAAKLGKPEHFTITVRDVTLSNGAGFVVVLTGNIMTMPGLPKAPSALKIDCDNNGNITGLF